MKGIDNYYCGAYCAEGRSGLNVTTPPRGVQSKSSSFIVLEEGIKLAILQHLSH
jgi:hypothetical protein